MRIIRPVVYNKVTFMGLKSKKSGVVVCISTVMLYVALGPTCNPNPKGTCTVKYRYQIMVSTS